jgi:hypothetical protein
VLVINLRQSAQPDIALQVTLAFEGGSSGLSGGFEILFIVSHQGSNDAVNQWITSSITLSFSDASGTVKANLSRDVTTDLWFYSLSGYGYSCAGTVFVGDPSKDAVTLNFQNVQIQPFNVHGDDVEPKPGGILPTLYILTLRFAPAMRIKQSSNGRR